MATESDPWSACYYEPSLCGWLGSGRTKSLELGNDDICARCRKKIDKGVSHPHEQSPRNHGSSSLTTSMGPDLCRAVVHRPHLPLCPKQLVLGTLCSVPGYDLPELFQQMAGVRKRNHHAPLPSPPARDHRYSLLRCPVGYRHSPEALGRGDRFVLDLAWIDRAADPAFQGHADALWDETQKTPSGGGQGLHPPKSQSGRAQHNPGMSRELPALAVANWAASRLRVSA